VLRLLPHIAYYFCIIIIILMQSIELARLVELDLGIGLIPVVYAGCLIAAIVHGTDSFRGKLVFGKFANLCFWLATIAVAGTKATAIHKFGRDVEENPLARHDTAYSIDHQITDLVILAIFAAGAFIFEVLVLVLGFVGRRKYGAGGGATVGAGKA
jgi:hypothetical protein